MLPLLYHTHHNAYPEDLPFWLDLAQQYGGPVLELGCGTGRVTLPLAQAGLDVIGIDYDREMLAFLQRSIGSAASRITIFQANMASFHLARKFPLILLPCNTLSSLDELDRKGVFERVAAHLSPEGVFAASLPNPVLLADMPATGPEEVEDEFLHPLTGNPIQVSSTWQRTKKYFKLTWHYDLLLPDGSVERNSIQTRHTLHSLDAYTTELEQAGLSLLASWGDFDRSVYNDDAPSLILMAGMKTR